MGIIIIPLVDRRRLQLKRGYDEQGTGLKGSLFQREKEVPGLDGTLGDIGG